MDGRPGEDVDGKKEVADSVRRECMETHEETKGQGESSYLSTQRKYEDPSAWQGACGCVKYIGSEAALSDLNCAYTIPLGY